MGFYQDVPFSPFNSVGSWTTTGPACTQTLRKRSTKSQRES